MVSKVDRTVDCRDFKKEIATVATSRLSIFRGFCCGFFIGFQWEMEEFVQNGLKIFKISVKVNSRLRGRSEILQQLTFLEKVDHTVDYGFKSKLTILSTSQKKIQRLSTSQKQILQQSIYRQKSTVDFNA